MGCFCSEPREGTAWEGGVLPGPCGSRPTPPGSVHSISNKELSELIEQLQKNADQVERNIVDTGAKMQSVSAPAPTSPRPVLTRVTAPQGHWAHQEAL